MKQVYILFAFLTAATISSAQSLAVALQTSGVSCKVGLCDGSITVANVANGTMPYTYIWSNNQLTKTATDLCAGMYTVTVTDSKGLTGTSAAPRTAF